MTRPLRGAFRWLHLFETARPTLRTEEVLPPSESDEGAFVFLTAAFVVLCMIYAVAFERAPKLGADAAPPARALLPFQVLFRDLLPAEQRMFRGMQEGLTEIVAARGTTAEWPSTEGLAAQGIPPFAPDVLDKAQPRWSRRDAGLLHQYVGVPTTPKAPAYMISILEPEPVTGEKVVPGVVDEEHQLLRDGTLLHVTYWKRIGDVSTSEAISDPALLGWTQIRVKTPLEELLEEK